VVIITEPGVVRMGNYVDMSVTGLNREDLRNGKAMADTTMPNNDDFPESGLGKPFRKAASQSQRWVSHSGRQLPRVSVG